MRRMMHAATFLLVTASLGQAQTVSIESQPAADRSVLSKSAEAQDYSGRPYSQLASYMSCSDWSPNLWNGYACERAATAAGVSKHVDMQCNCFDYKHRLHSRHSGLGGGDCSGESCKAGIGTKLANRYRQPMSTLYSAPSNVCKAPYEGVSGCESPMPSNQGEFTTHPDTVVRPLIPSITSSLRDRVATPVVKSPTYAISILNSQPSFDARR